MIEHINKLTDTVESRGDGRTGPRCLESAGVNKSPTWPSHADRAQPDALDEASIEVPNTTPRSRRSSPRNRRSCSRRADQAFDEWIGKTNQNRPIEELKRHLHTLKGGARMAGITAMGNLSHEIETLLIPVDDGRVKASRRSRI